MKSLTPHASPYFWSTKAGVPQDHAYWVRDLRPAKPSRDRLDDISVELVSHRCAPRAEYGAALDAVLSAWRAPSLPDLPPLHGGIIGYLGYDVVREVERLGAPPRDDLGSSRFTDNLSEAAPGDVVELDIQQFVMRAWVDEERELSGREVELTGFAVPRADGDGWYLARLQMACCAADAVVNKILITDHPAPEADTWWRVRGTWLEPEGDLYDVTQHEIETIAVEEVTNPPDPYE